MDEQTRIERQVVERVSGLKIENEGAYWRVRGIEPPQDEADLRTRARLYPRVEPALAKVAGRAELTEIGPDGKTQAAYSFRGGRCVEAAGGGLSFVDLGEYLRT